VVGLNENELADRGGENGSIGTSGDAILDVRGLGVEAKSR
jgi:hypothetical protein